MKCSDFLQELTNYLDGVLDETTKTELENHLSWCHNCYVVCDTTKKTIQIYRDSLPYELPDDLRTRLSKHNEGGNPDTANFRPWSIKTAIAFDDPARAANFERYLKTSSGRAFAKKHL